MFQRSLYYSSSVSGYLGVPLGELSLTVVSNRYIYASATRGSKPFNVSKSSSGLLVLLLFLGHLLLLLGSECHISGIFCPTVCSRGIGADIGADIGTGNDA